MGTRIYLIGGKDTSGATLTSIEYCTLNSNTWVLCDVTFQSVNRIHGAGAIPISDSEFLIFGGKTGPQHNTSESSDAYLVNVVSYEIEFFRCIGILGTFSAFQAAWTDDRSVASVFSAEGDLVHFDSSSR